MNDFEHVDRYLPQAAEDEHVDEWTQEFFANPHMTLLQSLELQRQLSLPSLLPHLIEREQAAKSGVSELAARLSSLYLEGTEEDADE